MQRALTGGSRLALRAGRPSVFPAELQPFTVRHSAVRVPLTAVERRVFWYGCPWPGDGRVDHLSIRVCGEKVCRLLMYLLEMDLRREFFGGRYAGLKAYAENSFTCSGCGSPLTVRSGPGGDCFLGCTAYPRCQHPIQKITPEILESYLSAAGLNCPAGHILKAIPARHGPIALCSHSPACRYVLQVRDLL
ncbi:MAG: topoisomerase DNA-binding C4 zinc finger domain-containing protein [Bacillota bacterium]